MEAVSLASIASVAGGAASTSTPVQIGYNVSLTDVGGFQQAMAGAASRLEAQPAAASGQGMRAVLQPLESVNSEAMQLSEIAKAAQAGSEPMTPGQIVALTVRSSEFMFHCQLTSNIANRTADGVQQLFRQQS